MGSLSVLLFLVFSLLGRFLFPFGDEPDFSIRAPRVLEGEHPWWSPFNILSNFFTSLNVDSNCVIDSSPFSLVAHIDVATCSESLEQIFTRWLLMLIIASPLLFIAVFRFNIVKNKEKKIENDYKQRAIALSILFPGAIYYLGVLAEEQFTLMLSLLIFVFWQKKILILGIMACIMSIDLGNSIVILFFVLSAWVYEYILKQYSFKIVFILMSIQLLFCYFIGFRILEYVAVFDLVANKSESISSSLSTGKLVEKYPVILRPVITYMTFVFSTASQVKVPILYVIYGLGAVFLSYRIYKRRNSLKNTSASYVLWSLVSLVTILSFVFLFPTYSNAKYYVFMIPFFIQSFLLVSYFKNIICLIFTTNIILYVHLLAYRV